jgi:hypothetical protein
MLNRLSAPEAPMAFPISLSLQEGIDDGMFDREASRETGTDFCVLPATLTDFIRKDSPLSPSGQEREFAAMLIS